MKKKVLIVGGAGFIGHNLALYLKKRNFSVLTVDNLKVNNLEFVKNNIKDKNKKKLYFSFIKERLNLLKKKKIPLKKIDGRDKNKLIKIFDKFKPDVVVHLAAVSHDNRSNEDPETTFDNSFRTLFNSLEASKKFKNIHFIFLSSSMVYGNFKKQSVLEDSSCEPLGIYGALKISGEHLIKSYSNVFGIKYTIVRPSALYGERCISNRVIQIFLENAFHKKNIFISGDGIEKLDFTYIEDLCQGIQKIIVKKSKSANLIFNITYGSARSIIDIKNLINKKFADQKFIFKSRNRLTATRGTLSIKKAKKLLGYSPKFNIFKGFQKYYNWYTTKIDDRN